MLPFTYAIMADGEMIRKMRWSNREAKWFKDNHPGYEIIKLEVPKEKNVFELIKEEALF